MQTDELGFLSVNGDLVGLCWIEWDLKGKCFLDGIFAKHDGILPSKTGTEWEPSMGRGDEPCLGVMSFSGYNYGLKRSILDGYPG